MSRRVIARDVLGRPLYRCPTWTCGRLTILNPDRCEVCRLTAHGAAQWRLCLKCDHRFWSRSAANRICDRCRAEALFDA